MFLRLWIKLGSSISPAGRVRFVVVGWRIV